MKAAAMPPAARPFLKWAGGKRAMLPVLRPFVPSAFGTYHEPFLGGAALFFDQQPMRAVLSDTNADLVDAYTAIRDDVRGVVNELRKHQAAHDRDHFEAVRRQQGRLLPSEGRAARLIYLNRTCYNGLYRVNKRGAFNVPFGDYKNPVICDERNLHACAQALKHATILQSSFEAVLDRAAPGDFVYCDPPYVPVSASSSFASYSREGFGRSDHRHLRDLALKLAARGVHVVLSNSNAPAVFDLYADGFDVRRVLAPRSIGAERGSRRTVEEVVILGPKQAAAVQCLVRLHAPLPEAPEPTALAISTPPEPAALAEVEPDFFPTFLGPLPEPVTDNALRARILRSTHFESLAALVREGHVSVQRSAPGVRWVEIPYQLVIDAEKKGGLTADEGVADVGTALRSPCWLIATAFGVEYLEPRTEGTAAGAAVARVQRIVESLLAPHMERLRAEAVPLWTQARAEYAERMARVPR